MSNESPKISKHTPGPWKLIPHPMSPYDTYGLWSEWEDNNVCDLHDVDRVDAELIRVAPELYDALVGMVNAVSVTSDATAIDRARSLLVQIGKVSAAR